MSTAISSTFTPAVSNGDDALPVSWLFLYFLMLPFNIMSIKQLTTLIYTG